MRTNVLLEEEDKGIFHLIQIKQPRAHSNWNTFTDPLIDCSNVSLVISS
jgi:hypothetical protein